MRNDGSTRSRYMRAGALVLGASLVLGACAKRDRGATDTTMATTTTTPATGMSDTGAMAGMNATPSGAAGMANMSDANILAVVSLANSNEIGGAKLAQTKATSADVKSFAAEMIKDHSAMQADADKLARQLNITPEAPPSAEQMKSEAKATSDSLKAAAKGKAFDTQYVNGEVREHESVLANLKQFEATTQNAQLKDLLGKAIPKVQQHLDRARQLQTALGTSA